VLAGVVSVTVRVESTERDFVSCVSSVNSFKYIFTVYTVTRVSLRVLHFGLNLDNVLTLLTDVSGNLSLGSF